MSKWIKKRAQEEELYPPEQQGTMAEFTIKAIRMGLKSLKTQLIIHDGEVAAESPVVSLDDKTYSELFDICRETLEGGTWEPTSIKEEV